MSSGQLSLDQEGKISSNDDTGPAVKFLLLLNAVNIVHGCIYARIQDETISMYECILGKRSVPLARMQEPSAARSCHAGVSNRIRIATLPGTQADHRGALSPLTLLCSIY